jgi:hypothetical protein
MMRPAPNSSQIVEAKSVEATLPRKPTRILSGCLASGGQVLSEQAGKSNLHCQLGNLCRPSLSHGLTCGAGYPRVTARDRSSPGLMAR